MCWRSGLRPRSKHCGRIILLLHSLFLVMKFSLFIFPANQIIQTRHLPNRGLKVPEATCHLTQFQSAGLDWDPYCWLSAPER